jgi:hypothetical protein
MHIGLNAHTYRLLIFKERSLLFASLQAVARKPRLLASFRLDSQQQRDGIMEPFFTPVKSVCQEFPFCLGNRL